MNKTKTTNTINIIRYNSLSNTEKNNYMPFYKTERIGAQETRNILISYKKLPNLIDQANYEKLNVNQKNKYITIKIKTYSISEREDTKNIGYKLKTSDVSLKQLKSFDGELEDYNFLYCIVNKNKNKNYIKFIAFKKEKNTLPENISLVKNNFKF